MKRGLLHHLRGATRQIGITPKAGDPSKADCGLLVISPQVRASAEGDGLALLAIDSGLLFTCNRTGSQVWRGLEARRTPAAIAAEISRELGLPEDRAGACVAGFVGELRRLGLLLPAERS